MAEVYTKGGQAAYSFKDADGTDHRLVLAWSPGDPPLDLAAHGVPAGTVAGEGSDDPTQNLAIPPPEPTRQQVLQDQVHARIQAREQAEAERAFMHAYEEWVLGGQKGTPPQLSDFPANSEPPPVI